MDNTKERKQLIIYIAIAYGVTYLMGLLMWYGNSRQLDLTTFPTAQMFYPAAGVMAAILCTKRDDAMVPRLFYWFFVLATVVMAAFAVLSICKPNEIIIVMGTGMSLWAVGQQYLMIAVCVVGWVLLLITKKEKRRAYGLCLISGISSWWYIFLFMLLYFGRVAVSVAISGEFAAFSSILKSATFWIQLAVLPVNFFLLFAAFFGEEYGWRYYLQPFLQKRFGLRGGVLLLGLVWGIWHLPVDLFYYTQDSQFMMVLTQHVTCVTLGIFFAYAYMKTNNIWVPVILHYLNNNLVPIISGNYSASVLENQTVTWKDLLVSLVINGLVFGGFLLTKPFRTKTQS